MHTWKNPEMLVDSEFKESWGNVRIKEKSGLISVW